MGRETFPCVGFLWIMHVVIPTVVIPNLIRLYRFRAKSLLSKRVGKVSARMLDEKFSRGSSLSSDLGVRDRRGRFLESDEIAFIRNKSFHLKTRFAVLYVTLGCLPFLAFIVFLRLRVLMCKHRCVGCFFVPWSYVIFFVQSVVISTAVVYVVGLVKDEPDPTHFLWETRVSATVAGTLAGLSALLGILDPQYVDRTGKYNWALVLCLAFLCAHHLSVVHPLLCSYGYFAPKRLTRTSRDSRGELLSKILSDEDANALLNAYMVDEWSSENIRFIEDVIAFKALSSGKQQIKRARVMCALYVQPDAVLSLNLSFDVRQRILTTLAHVGEVDIGTLFDAANDEICCAIASDTLPRFLHDDSFVSWRQKHAERGFNLDDDDYAENASNIVAPSTKNGGSA